MENKKIIKPKLKDEFLEKMYYDNPHMFEKNEKVVKIDLSSRYYKGMQMNMDMRNAMFKKLSVCYIGYLTLLIDVLDYENKIDLYYLKNFNISKSMIDSCVRPKLISIGAIKKFEGKFYLNPLFAYKGKSLNPKLLQLFKDTNNILYGVRL